MSPGRRGRVSVRDRGNGFAIEVVAIGSPGMVSGRRFRERSAAVKLFGVQYLGLWGELLVRGVGKGLVLVEDRDFSFRIFANGDGRLLQSIDGALGLDLVNELVVLDSEVLREHAGFLVSEDQIQVIPGAQGTMSIVGAASRHRKAAIEVFPKFFQI